MEPRSRTLLDGGAPVKVRRREWEILDLLVQRAGEFVTNEEIIRTVWPHQGVSEANLRVQIGTLRRLLGEDRSGQRFIINVTGRGYCFAEDVRVRPERPVEASPAIGAAKPSSSHAQLPSALSRMIGRDDTLDRLTAHLRHQRLLTLCGPGGIGKTTLAVAMARRYGNDTGADACFTDFASLNEAKAVPAAVANALGLFGMSKDAMTSVVHHLRDRHLLLVLDNCEHLLAEVAALAEVILTSCPGVRILATSREAIRLDGEWVHRLSALDYPPRSTGLMAAEAAMYPAVQLFVERASASQETFVLSDNDAPLAAEICRRLDGIPLAIELAAARIEAFGIAELRHRLADSLQILKQGRRSTVPRQQTLTATVEWSFNLLSEAEQRALVRLSVFKSAFTLDQASRVLDGLEFTGADYVDAIYELSTKSLIEADTSSDPAQFRLLELTRAFCRDRFSVDPAFHSVSERHAHLCLALSRTAEAEWRERDWPAWTARHGRWMDDMRAAIDWAYDTDRQRLGVELVAASATLAMRMSLMPEYLGRIDDALQRLQKLGEPAVDLELRLRLEQSFSIQYTHGDRGRMDVAMSEMRQLWQRVSSLPARFESASGLYGMAFGKAAWIEAGEAADLVRALVPFSDDPGILTTADRMRAQVDHYQGRLRRAADLARMIIARPDDHMPSTFSVATRMDPKVTMRILLVRSDWLEGRPDTALVSLDECLEVSRRAAGPQYCYALACAAIPVCAWRGDRDAALEYCRKLEVEASALSLDYWENWARAYVRILDGEGVALAAVGKTPIDGRSVFPLQFDEICTLRPDLADDDMFDRVRRGELGWSAPELLREQAEALAKSGASDDEVDTALREALALATSQDALSWRLRIATSLAKRSRGAGVEEARERLAEIFGQFVEGFETADLRAAALWLAENPAAEPIAAA